MRQRAARGSSLVWSVTCLLALMATACGAAPESDPPVEGSEPGAPEDTATPGAPATGSTTRASYRAVCNAGQTEKCTVVVMHGSYETCAPGVRHCTRGQWGPCVSPYAEEADGG